MDVPLIAQLAGPALRQATVLRVEEDGTVVVRERPDADELLCERLQTADRAALTLAPRDLVLVWQPDAAQGRGVVLGRVGLSHAAAPLPDELLLEAREQLTLRVGDGSITLRGDGRVLIKGRDLVSHAQRLNRIRGGAVSIN